MKVFGLKSKAIILPRDGNPFCGGGKPYLKKEQRPLALCKDRKVSSFDPDGNIGAREMIVTFYFVRNRENKIRLIGCDEY